MVLVTAAGNWIKEHLKEFKLFLPKQQKAADTSETTNQSETNIQLLFFMSRKSQQWKRSRTHFTVEVRGEA